MSQSAQYRDKPKPRRLPQAAAVVALGAGGLALVAWSCRLSALQIVGLSIPTALYFLFIGCSLWLLSREMTRRQRAERRVRRLARTYAVLTKSNQMILRVRERQTLFDEACRIAVDEGKLRAACIGLLDSAQGAVKIVSRAGAADEFPDEIPIGAEDDPAGLGNLRIAIRDGREAISQDLEQSSCLSPWRVQALKRGCHSIAAFPLKTGERAIGVYILCADTAHFFDRRERRLLNELAADLSFAISYLEKEAQRQQAESALHTSEDQLRQSQKLEAIGRLAGGVAHDFNNLLVVMSNTAELLLLDPTQHRPRTLEGLKQIKDAGERAANLTRQLLAFGRKQLLQPQPLVLNELVGNLTKMLNRIIGEDVQLQCRYAADLPYVHADRGMLEQVLVNLVVNARDAMPRGGQLSISTEKLTLTPTTAHGNGEARSGDFACLTVTDTGTGIAAEHLPHIFEPFFTTKELGRGTGLGLATVYGIVKQHQGWVEVSSRPGAGSTFRILLPAIPAPTHQPQAAVIDRPIPQGTETVLLVEDDAAVRNTTRSTLETFGYRVHEAGCAKEAFDAWASYQHEITLLLSDIVMPGGLNGRELARRLQAASPNLGVILMSGYNEEIAGKDTELIRRDQIQFLQKPWSTRRLLEAVRACLDQKVEAVPN